MNTGVKRAVSCMLAIVMLAAQLPAAADEWTVRTEAAQEDTELLPAQEEIQPVYHTVTLPWYEECGYVFDESRMVMPEQEEETKEDQQEREKKEIRLLYATDETVQVGIQLSGSLPINEIHIYGYEKKDMEYMWTEEGAIVFAMPDEDVTLDVSFMTPITEPVQNEVTESEPVQSEPVQSEPQQSETVQGESVQSEPVQSEPVQNEATESEPITSEPVQSEPQQSEVYQEETDSDGLPKQGSIVSTDPITIPFDTWDFDQYSDFRNIPYSTEQCKIEYISDDIIYDEVGTYSCIYRVSDKESGKFWFVLRPVQVSESAQLPTETDGSLESEQITEQETEGALETELLTEVETEQRQETELCTEQSELSQETMIIAEPETELWQESGTGQTEEVTETEADTEGQSESGSETRSEQETETETEEQTEAESDPEQESESETELYGIAVLAEEDIPDFTLEIDGSTCSAPASLKSGDASTTYKTVIFYEDDGTEIKRMAYCIQPKALSPGNGQTYTKDDVEALDGSTSAEKKMNKAMYYLYGGPAWGKTISYADDSDSVNLKTVMTEAGCSTWKHYYTMTHYILSYIYMGGSNWNYNSSEANVLNSSGVSLVKEVVGYLNKLPLPTSKLTQVDVGSYYNSGTGMLVSDSITYKAIDENSATITLPDGIIFFNETTGTRSTGKATLDGGTIFHLEASPNIQGTGRFELNCKYATDYTALKLTLSGKQDIGFSYYSGEKSLPFSIEWDNPYKPIEIQKYDAQTGQAAAQGKGATFAGAEYTIYSDAACANKVETVITNESGHGTSAELPIATYYVKEIKAPTGYALDPTVYTVAMNAADSASVYTVSSKESPLLEAIEVQKYDSVTGQAAPQGKGATFAGAEYTIYSDAGCTVPIEVLTTNVSGYAKSSQLTVSTYYVKETKAPIGYELDPNVYTVEMSHGDAVSIYPVSSQEAPRREAIALQKKDKETGLAKPYNSYASFAGAEYTIYSDAACQNAVEVLKTDGNGYAKSSQLIVSTYYIKETKAPTGYELDQMVYTVDMNHTDTVSVYAVESAEQVIRKPIELQKVDAESGAAAPQNSAVCFADAEYTIYSDQACTKQVEVLKTDEKGYAKSSDLPVGTYFIKETKAPTGYQIDKGLYSVTVSDDGKLVYPIRSAEQVIRGSLSLMKFLDDNYEKAVLQDRVESGILAGITFTLKHEDETVPKIRITTDKYGHAATEKEALVYGTWYVSEDPDTVPEGYEWITDVPIHITEEENDLKYVVSDNLPASQIRLIKKDAHTGEAVNVSGGVFQIIDAEGNAVTMPNPLNYADLTEFFTLNNGMIHFTTSLKAGTYTIRELEAPEGYLIGNDVSFTVTENRDYLDPLVIEFADEPQMGQILIQKQDKDTGEVLGEGFTFEVYAAEDILDGSGGIRTVIRGEEQIELRKGTLIETIQTGADGTAQTQELYLGSYLVRESVAGECYAIGQTEYPVTLLPDAEQSRVSAYLSIENEKTRAGILKIDAEDSSVMAGVRFRVYSSSDLDTEKARQIAEAVEELRISQNPAREAFLTQQEEALAYYEKEEHSEEERAAFLFVQQKELEAYDDRLQRERDALEAQLQEELQVTEVSGLGTEYSTDAEGYILLEDLKHGCHYFIYETATLPGYNLDPSVYEFSVDENGLIGGQARYELKISNQPNQLEISKTDLSGENELPGATLMLKDQEGNVIETWVSTEEPYQVNGLAAGSYTLTEETAPEGYSIAEDITFELTDSLQVQQVVMKDDLIRVSISKKDITNEEELPGAHLQVTDEEGEVIEKWISGEEPHLMNLPAGSYFLTEVITPEKYATAETVAFTVTTDLEVQQVVMYDQPLDVEISKQDSTTKQELAGARLQITDKEGELIEEWISGEEPHRVNLAVGTYTLTEVVTPEKYATAESLTFEVTDTREVQQVVMYDQPLLVEISKQDSSNGQALAGARMMITGEDGTVLDTWTSTGDAHQVNLALGTYTLTEVAAPEGYATAESITFEVTDTKEVQQVVMYDQPLAILISKQDLTGQQELAGASLQITDPDGKVIEEWISQEEPHQVNLATGTYTLTEVAAPERYARAESITFEVTDTREVQNVTMYDQLIEVEVAKKEQEGGTLLVGASLTITDQDGKVVEEWISGEEAHKVNLATGTYTLTEVAAPEKYARAESITFEVTDTREVQQVVMYDQLICVSIAKKDLTTDALLAGAQLQICDKEGTVVEEWTSVEEAHQTNLAVGEYTLVEVTAPYGYEVSEAVPFTVTDDREVQPVTMYDAPKDGTVDLTGKEDTKTTTTGGTPAASGGGGSLITPAVLTGDWNRYLPALLTGGAGVILLLWYLLMKRKHR